MKLRVRKILRGGARQFSIDYHKRYFDMVYSQDFEYAIGWNHFSLDLIGAWPEENIGKLKKETTTFWVLCIILLIYLPQSASVFIYWGNMNEVVGCLSVNGPVFLAFSKLFLFRYRRKELRILIDFMNEDWINVNGQKEYEIMLKIAKISRSISIGSGLLTNTLFVAYIFYMIYLGVVMSKRTDLDPRLAIGLLYPAWVPFDTKKNEYFVPMWIGQFFCTFVCMSIYAVFDCMIAAFVLHICGQLSIIGLSFRNLIKEHTESKSNSFNENLALIVERHEKLNELAKIVENSFNLILLPQLFVCTLTFCFQGFSLMMGLLDPATGKISFLEIDFSITYVIYTVLHLYVYCYVGEQLIVESLSLGTSVYGAQWYNLPVSKIRIVLFVGYRATRPLKITAGKFFVLSRYLFRDVIKTSMGYLSMLLTVKARMVS